MADKKKKAFTMHSGQLSARLFENYKNIIPRYNRAQRVEAYENPDKRVILGKWTNVERKWAEMFEQMEYAIERGNTTEALRIEKELRGRDLTNQEKSKTRAISQVKERCNPNKAEAWRNDQMSRKTSDRDFNQGMYTADDWIRQRFATDPETGEEFELAVTLSAEDALIEALDAARLHNVSLDEFINDPKYHTPERKAGRPKKIHLVEEV